MNLELNCANVFDDGKGINIPPQNAKKYHIEVGPQALRAYIEKGGDIVVIPVENNKALDVER